ncbi:MAG: hypothetical protein K2X00_16825, partial [Nitrospiraceae bacterium]|nr:hypothetical protein [Nitrospiraceae bacterium]
LRHTDAEWAQDDPIPAGCPSGLTPEDVKRVIRQIPTLFKIDEDCHAPLLFAAAKKVVEKQQGRIVTFLQAAPAH